MESILGYLEELEDLVDSCRPVPFSGKISVNKDEIFDIVSDIRLNLPTEIRQAQRIAADCDKIVNEATTRANSIIRDAEAKANRMMEEHEITRLAHEEAVRIVDEAKQTSRNIRVGAIEYADEILSKTEQIVKSTFDSYSKHSREVEDYLSHEIDTIYSNRQELRGE